MSSRVRPADAGVQLQSAPLRVLIADGYADAADSLALLLALWCHEVHVARSGPEALEAAHAFRPDVLLAEIVLPGMNGLDLVARLPSAPARSEMVLVALTGLGDPASRLRVRQAGYRHHLLKPADPDALQALLDSVTPRRSPGPVAVLAVCVGREQAPPPSRRGLATVK